MPSRRAKRWLNEKVLTGLYLFAAVLWLMSIFIARLFDPNDSVFIFMSAAWCFGGMTVCILLFYVMMGFDAAHKQREALRQESK